MIRIATSIIILAALPYTSQAAGTGSPTVDSLSERLTAIEKRLSSVETSLGGSREQAMMNATKSNSTYVIQDGDTLGSIANKHDVPRSALLSANKLREGQPIYIGESLVIPSAPTKLASKTESKPVSKTTSSPRIAPPVIPEKKAPAKTEPKKSASVVVKSPDVKKPAPKEEKKAPASATYTVRSGDTLHRIALNHGMTVAALKSNNGLSSDMISPGQKLKISNKKESKAPAKATAQADVKSDKKKEADPKYDNPLLKANESYGYYSVAKGDNLYALARDFFTSMPELQRLNKLGKSTIIHPGDELIVPTSKYNAYHKNVAKQ